MMYSKTILIVPRYELTSGYGFSGRFKKACSHSVPAVTMSCNSTDAEGLRRLIILGDMLNVPVKYNFKESTASISLAGLDTLQKELKLDD